MDGLLVIDKPAGPTSHEVVARVRRALGERRIGHTGTLDPAATGVLPLVLGRATRLARFLSASDKSYEAIVRLGTSTDTCDLAGTPIGPAFAGTLPTREAVDSALDAFRGPFLQQPPAYSAKKIDGQRSYALARRHARLGATDGAGSGEPQPTETPRLPSPVSVTAHMITILDYRGTDLSLTVDCSAGFYIRSLAQDLGQRLGTGAHLAALRRTRTGDLGLDGAVSLAALEADPRMALEGMTPLSRMLPGLSSVTLTSEGIRHAVQGRNLGRSDLVGAVVEATWLRLVDADGGLVALATKNIADGFLHPSIVLV
jgi:tRNA pseudouridine55 synthase